MIDRKIHLFWGTLVLLLAYIGGNVYFRTRANQHNVTSPEIQETIQRGQVIAESCAACHYLDQRTHFVGPHLVSVIGRPIGRAEGYEYSDAMRNQTGEWTAEKLSAFLSGPQQFAPGTKMGLVGWPKDEVQALVTYLQSKE